MINKKSKKKYINKKSKKVQTANGLSIPKRTYTDHFSFKQN